MTERARALRNAGTDAERALWRLLSRYRPPFTRQLVIGPYIIDLACREATLAVEFDGSQHLERTAYERRRTAHLSAEGWCVIRFWNSEVGDKPEGVAQSILQKAAECLGGTGDQRTRTAGGSSLGHPQPLPSREGRTRRPRTRLKPQE